MIFYKIFHKSKIIQLKNKLIIWLINYNDNILSVHCRNSLPVLDPSPIIRRNNVSGFIYGKKIVALFIGRF
jgi:hypothetical protein